MFRFVFDDTIAKLLQASSWSPAKELQSCRNLLQCGECHINNFQNSAMKWIFALSVIAEAGNQAALNINWVTFTKVTEEMVNLNLSQFLGSVEKRGWPFCRSITISKTAIW